MIKNLRSLVCRWLLVSALAISWSSLALAVEAFEQAGAIRAINGSGFRVEDQEYRIAPGARLQSFDASRKRLADFKVGDIIVFQGKLVDGVYYVDLIIYYAPLPS